MRYLTLEDIHHQCKIEPDFTDDDPILTTYGEAAENFLEVHLNRSLDDISAENAGVLPKALYQSLLILVDYSYDNSGSGEQREIPQAFFMLTKPFQTWAVF